MWLGIEEVLVNVLIILFPLLIYAVFFKENRADREKTTSYFHVVLLIVLLLCMFFPASYSSYTTFDFRLLPVIIAFIYGGVYASFGLVVCILLLTLLIDPSDFFASVGNYFIASVILYRLRPLCRDQPVQRKIFLLSLFFLAVSSTRIIYFYNINHTEQLPFIIWFSVIKWVTLIMVIVLIENMKKQQRMQHELEQYEKMNAVSQLAAGVAHEIRNPMTTVRGFLQILNNSNEVPDKNKTYITISIDELDRAHKIINEYLALTRPQKNVSEEINLTGVLNDAISILTSYAVIHNVEIISSIEESLAISGYKHEIQQVIINLMKNGIESTEDGGILEVYALKKGRDIEVVIKDNGHGMSKSELKRLGNPYYTTKESGTGLGLTVSYQIISRMHGKIDVQSTVGHGTIFTILLPAE